MAQPSLSDQIRRLEAELGVALFTRAGRRLVLTEAGRTLRPHAERDARARPRRRPTRSSEVRTLAGGTVSFGTFGSAHHYLLGGLVQDFRRRHPDVRVRVVGQNSVEVADAVRDGQLEAGLVALPIDDSGLDVRPVDPRGEPLRQRRPGAHARPQDDRGPRRRAADPLRRPLGRRSTRCGGSSRNAPSGPACGSSRRSRSST